MNSRSLWRHSLLGHFRRKMFADNRASRAVFVFGICTIITIAVLANQTIEQQRVERFHSFAGQIARLVKYRLEVYASALRGVRSMVELVDELTSDRFRRYVGGLNVAENYPGMAGIGYVHRIKAEEVDNFLSEFRRETDTSLSIFPLGVRAEYFPILFFIPYNPQSRPQIGFDISSDPFRLEALTRARDEGTVALTGKVNLTQEIGGEAPGFQIYVPVYKGAQPHQSSIDERRAHLGGYIHASFVSHDFFDSFLFSNDHSKELSIEVFDKTNREGSKLYESSPHVLSASCEGCLHTVREISFGGNTWVLQFTAASTFEAASDRTLVFILCLVQFGLVVIIWRLTLLQQEARQAAERAVQQKEKSLAGERAARTESERAGRIKEEFLATVSHELRSPLNAILGWTQLINKPKVSPEHLQKGLTTIEKNVRIQVQLIEDLLDMSRVTSGKLQLEFQPIELLTVINDAVEAVQPSAELKGIKIETHLSSAPFPVRIDSGRMQQVLWNLLSNSIKFSQSGSKILVTATRDPKHVEVSIEDNGIGISPEVLPHIFERFRQADPSITRKHGGLGLGLAISNYIVQHHEGTLIAKSDGLGKGATFTLRLPLIQGDISSQIEKHSTNGYVTPDRKLGDLSVLIVDDEGDAREVLRRILEEYGATVTIASSVSEAINIIQEKTFHLVISDLSMPDQDGFELAKWVRRHGNVVIQKIPLIALSALVRPEDKRRAERSGFSAHIAKPVDVQALVQTISGLI